MSKNTEDMKNVPLRSFALDALRGLAIIGMIFSGMLPGTLPAWMHHARTPPPTGAFDKTIMGITWVDLVLPFFVFALGAAIPFALRRKTQQNLGTLKVCGNVISRYVLLAFFAIFLPQIATAGWIGVSSDILVSIVTILGFTIMFAMFARFPQGSLLAKKQNWINFAGFALLILIFVLRPVFGLQPFSLQKNNIILMILANTYLVTALLWVFTRNNIALRCFGLLMLTAVRFSCDAQGSNWVKEAIDMALNTVNWGNISVVSCILSPTFIQFAHIAVIGTVIGEWVADWIADQKNDAALPASCDNTSPQWGACRLIIISVLFFSFNVLLCAGLFARYDAWVFLVTLISILPIAYLMRNPKTSFEKCMSKIGYAAWILILTGLVFGPANDGIHKDGPSTIGYLYCTAGLACFTLASLIIVIDRFGCKRGFGLLIVNGQNPMIAYVIGGHLLWPILSVVGIDVFLSKGLNDIFNVTAGGTIWAILKTLLLMFCVAFFTKRKIFWRT